MNLKLLSILFFTLFLVVVIDAKTHMNSAQTRMTTISPATGTAAAKGSGVAIVGSGDYGTRTATTVKGSGRSVNVENNQDDTIRSTTLTGATSTAPITHAATGIHGARSTTVTAEKGTGVTVTGSGVYGTRTATTSKSGRTTKAVNSSDQTVRSTSTTAKTSTMPATHSSTNTGADGNILTVGYNTNGTTGGSATYSGTSYSVDQTGPLGGTRQASVSTVDGVKEYNSTITTANGVTDVSSAEKGSGFTSTITGPDENVSRTVDAGESAELTYGDDYHADITGPSGGSHTLAIKQGDGVTGVTFIPGAVNRSALAQVGSGYSSRSLGLSSLDQRDVMVKAGVDPLDDDTYSFHHASYQKADEVATIDVGQKGIRVANETISDTGNGYQASVKGVQGGIRTVTVGAANPTGETGYNATTTGENGNTLTVDKTADSITISESGARGKHTATQTDGGLIARNGSGGVDNAGGSRTTSTENSSDQTIRSASTTAAAGATVATHTGTATGSAGNTLTTNYNTDDMTGASATFLTVDDQDASYDVTDKTGPRGKYARTVSGGSGSYSATTTNESNGRSLTISYSATSGPSISYEQMLTGSEDNSAVETTEKIGGTVTKTFTGAGNNTLVVTPAKNNGTTTNSATYDGQAITEEEQAGEPTTYDYDGTPITQADLQTIAAGAGYIAQSTTPS